MLYVDKSMVMTPVLVLLAILEALQTVDLSVPVTKLVFSRNVLMYVSAPAVVLFGRAKQQEKQQCRSIPRQQCTASNKPQCKTVTNEKSLY